MAPKAKAEAPSALDILKQRAEIRFKKIADEPQHKDLSVPIPVVIPAPHPLLNRQNLEPKPFDFLDTLVYIVAYDPEGHVGHLGIYKQDEQDSSKSVLQRDGSIRCVHCKQKAHAGTSGGIQHQSWSEGRWVVDMDGKYYVVFARKYQHINCPASEFITKDGKKGNKTWLADEPEFMKQFHPAAPSLYPVHLTKRQGVTSVMMAAMAWQIGSGMTNFNKVSQLLQVVQRWQYEEVALSYLMLVAHSKASNGAATAPTSSRHSVTRTGQPGIKHFFAAARKQPHSSPAAAVLATEVIDLADDDEHELADMDVQAALHAATAAITNTTNPRLPDHLQLPDFRGRPVSASTLSQLHRLTSKSRWAMQRLLMSSTTTKHTISIDAVVTNIAVAGIKDSNGKRVSLAKALLMVVNDEGQIMAVWGISDANRIAEATADLKLLQQRHDEQGLPGPRVVFCDHYPFFEGPLRQAFPNLGQGLDDLTRGIKEDVLHAVSLKIKDKGMHRANPMRGEAVDDLSRRFMHVSVPDLLRNLQDLKDKYPHCTTAAVLLAEVPLKFWMNKARRQVPQPDVLVPLLLEWYFYWRDYGYDSTSNTHVFGDGFEGVFFSQLQHAMDGYLSDPRLQDGSIMDLYQEVPLSNGNVQLKSCRGTPHSEAANHTVTSLGAGRAIIHVENFNGSLVDHAIIYNKNVQVAMKNAPADGAWNSERMAQLNSLAAAVGHAPVYPYFEGPHPSATARKEKCGISAGEDVVVEDAQPLLDSVAGLLESAAGLQDRADPDEADVGEQWSELFEQTATENQEKQQPPPPPPQQQQQQQQQQARLHLEVPALNVNTMFVKQPCRREVAAAAGQLSHGQRVSPMDQQVHVLVSLHNQHVADLQQQFPWQKDPMQYLLELRQQHQLWRQQFAQNLFGSNPARPTQQHYPTPRLQQHPAQQSINQRMPPADPATNACPLQHAAPTWHQHTHPNPLPAAHPYPPVDPSTCANSSVPTPSITASTWHQHPHPNPVPEHPSHCAGANAPAPSTAAPTCHQHPHPDSLPADPPTPPADPYARVSACAPAPSTAVPTWHEHPHPNPLPAHPSHCAGASTSAPITAAPTCHQHPHPNPLPAHPPTAPADPSACAAVCAPAPSTSAPTWHQHPHPNTLPAHPPTDPADPSPCSSASAPAPSTAAPIWNQHPHPNTLPAHPPNPPADPYARVNACAPAPSTAAPTWHQHPHPSPMATHPPTATADPSGRPGACAPAPSTAAPTSHRGHPHHKPLPAHPPTASPHPSACAGTSAPAPSTTAPTGHQHAHSKPLPAHPPTPPADRSSCAGAWAPGPSTAAPTAHQHPHNNPLPAHSTTPQADTAGRVAACAPAPSTAAPTCNQYPHPDPLLAHPPTTPADSSARAGAYVPAPSTAALTSHQHPHPDPLPAHPATPTPQADPSPVAGASTPAPSTAAPTWHQHPNPMPVHPPTNPSDPSARVGASAPPAPSTTTSTRHHHPHHNPLPAHLLTAPADPSARAGACAPPAPSTAAPSWLQPSQPSTLLGPSHVPTTTLCSIHQDGNHESLPSWQSPTPGTTPAAGSMQPVGDMGCHVMGTREDSEAMQQADDCANWASQASAGEVSTDAILDAVADIPEVYSDHAIWDEEGGLPSSSGRKRSRSDASAAAEAEVCAPSAKPRRKIPKHALSHYGPGGSKLSLNTAYTAVETPDEIALWFALYPKYANRHGGDWQKMKDAWNRITTSSLQQIPLRNLFFKNAHLLRAFHNRVYKDVRVRDLLLQRSVMQARATASSTAPGCAARRVAHGEPAAAGPPVQQLRIAAGSGDVDRQDEPMPDAVQHQQHNVRLLPDGMQGPHNNSRVWQHPGAHPAATGSTLDAVAAPTSSTGMPGRGSGQLQWFGQGGRGSDRGGGRLQGGVQAGLSGSSMDGPGLVRPGRGGRNIIKTCTACTNRQGSAVPMKNHRCPFCARCFKDLRLWVLKVDCKAFHPKAS